MIVARPTKLKVFRMPIGFHDAYVAAPSQKAAVEAWGSEKDVFARGEAELVTDPALMEEPLASPGKIVKRLRGTAEEQIAALGASEPDAKAPAKTKKAAKPKPRPSRAKLEAAEEALAAAEEKQAEALRRLAEREAALARERRELERLQAQERAELAAKVEKEEAAYEQALQRWREEV